LYLPKVVVGPCHRTGPQYISVHVHLSTIAIPQEGYPFPLSYEEKGEAPLFTHYFPTKTFNSRLSGCCRFAGPKGIRSGVITVSVSL